MRAAVARQDRAHNDRAWLAYHIAALAHVHPRRLHKQYEKMLHRARKRQREMTPDEMWASLMPMTYSKS